MELHAKTLTEQDLRDAHDQPVSLAHGDFSNCVFTKCDFTDRDLTGASFIDCTFDHCNLSNVRVDNASFQNVRFTGCKLLGLAFTRVNALLISWIFEDCQLSFCNFSALNMKGSQFLACEIKECDFMNVNLTGADFAKSDLVMSRFPGTNLEKANLVGAKNYYLDPTKTKLKGARFAYPEVLALLEGFGIVVE
jgi:uncharacterized protein YjbI with pentapeptide repeats